jgi:acetylornithine/N-succinyldiaminopimelate aminotransferase
VIRLAPPLILTTEQVDAFLAALPAALSTAQATVDTTGGDA